MNSERCPWVESWCLVIWVAQVAMVHGELVTLGPLPDFPWVLRLGRAGQCSLKLLPIFQPSQMGLGVWGGPGPPMCFEGHLCLQGDRGRRNKASSQVLYLCRFFLGSTSKSTASWLLGAPGQTHQPGCLSPLLFPSSPLPANHHPST